MELERLKDPSTEPFSTGNLTTTPLILPTPLCMKTMKSEVLKGEVLLEMILVTSILRHQSLMVASNQRTTLIGFKPLGGSLSLRSTMNRKPLD